MPKTKESIAAYNKEYFARPEVIARAKVRNAERKHKRDEYKKTPAGIIANKKYRHTANSIALQEKSRLKNRYGITPVEVEAMKVKQNGLCAICNRPPIHWHIDHDHKTNKVRGMLCGPCNMGLGLFRDDSTCLRKAADYLEGNNHAV